MRPYFLKVPESLGYIEIMNTLVQSILVEESENLLTVLYHQGCPDGVAGACAVFIGLTKETRDRLEKLGGIYTTGEETVEPDPCGPVFLGVQHGYAPPPNLIEGRNVVYVDIAPTSVVLQSVRDKAKRLVILDHHKSARRDLDGITVGGNYYLSYSEEKSGAELAWEWAWPAIRLRNPGTSDGVPGVIQYVADRDLWKFALPNSKEINAALWTENRLRGFGWATRMSLLATPMSQEVELMELTERGGYYLAHAKKMIDGLAACASPGEITTTDSKTYKVLVVNTSTLVSELGNTIASQAPADVHFVVMWSYNAKKHEIWASARTNRDDVDLSAITRSIPGLINGGGHAKAAGFSIAGDSISAVIRRTQS
jgi:uncharacterized protein